MYIVYTSRLYSTIYEVSLDSGMKAENSPQRTVHMTQGYLQKFDTKINQEVKKSQLDIYKKSHDYRQMFLTIFFLGKTKTLRVPKPSF